MHNITGLVESRTLLLGTSNRKKIIELVHLLEPRGFRLRTPSDFEDVLEVDETGDTFMANAQLKAVAQAKHRQVWAIGEDSGLCVPALQGEPGIYSARYAGPGATDAHNNAKLLVKMTELPDHQRQAYYVSTMALSDPSGHIHIQTQGECWGRILRVPRGERGFGYDPLFEIAEYHLTFAEMGQGVKRAISHRARALRSFLARLDCLVA
ncbi:MAG: RdgB/HAM1 family non-canonical purine NTP pyrophosphatase [Pirellula sp.]